MEITSAIGCQLNKPTCTAITRVEVTRMWLNNMHIPLVSWGTISTLGSFRPRFIFSISPKLRQGISCFLANALKWLCSLANISESVTMETVHQAKMETVHQAKMETVHQAKMETVHQARMETVHQAKMETVHDRKWMMETVHDRKWMMETVHDRKWMMETVHDRKWRMETVHDRKWMMETVHDRKWMMETVHDRKWMMETVHDRKWMMETTWQKVNDGNYIEMIESENWKHNRNWTRSHNDVNTSLKTFWIRNIKSKTISIKTVLKIT